MIGLDLIAACAPQVAPPTIAAIIRVESGGNPLAIGINGPMRLSRRPVDAADAARLARTIMQAGYSVDLGLMQINSRNLPGLGLTVEQVFDPCTNIRAGATILTRGYLGATRRWGPGQDALKAALSAYNTGNYEAGFRNGYVAKVYGVRPTFRATLRVVVDAPAASLAENASPTERPRPPDPYSADSTVYMNPNPQRRLPDDNAAKPQHLAPNPFAEPG